MRFDTSDFQRERERERERERGRERERERERRTHLCVVCARVFVLEVMRNTLKEVLQCVCSCKLIGFQCAPGSVDILSTLLFLHCPLRAHVRCKRLYTLFTLHYTTERLRRKQTETVRDRQTDRQRDRQRQLETDTHAEKETDNTKIGRTRAV